MNEIKKRNLNKSQFNLNYSRQPNNNKFIYSIFYFGATKAIKKYCGKYKVELFIVIETIQS